MPQDASWMDAMPTLAAPQGVAMPGSAAPAPQPHWDQVQGVGSLPDGSATRDPAVWERWMKDYQPDSAASTGTVGTGTAATGAALPQTNAGGAQALGGNIPQGGPTPQIAIHPDQPSPTSGGSWMDAMPALQPTPEMQAATAKPPGGAPPGKMTGVLANAGAGTSDAVAGALGGPVDLATGAINLIPRGINALAGTNIPTIQSPVGGSDWWRGAEGLVGADPRNVAPNNQLERLARAGGEGAGNMLLGWTGANALPALAGIPGTIQRTLGAGGAPTMAASGLTGGALGQEASDSVPAPYKPIASLAGNIIGGGLPIAATAAAHGVTDAAVPIVRNFMAPLTAGGREGLAAQRIAGAAHDVGAVRNMLDDASAADARAAPLQAILSDPNATAAAKAAAQQQMSQISGRSQIVPGSKPTTYQLTGDQGLGNLERAVTKDHPDQFLSRAAHQNAARVGAIEGQAPAGASPDAVGTAFREHLAALDAQSGAEVAAAQRVAQGATSATGGAVPVGADAQTTALQSFGQRLRGGLSALNDVAKKRVSKLYDAVDPDGTLAVDTSAIKSTAREISKDIPKNAAPMEGDAARILGVAQMQPKVVPFKEIAALRSRLTDAMRTELYANGRTATYRTMTQLLAAVDDTLAGGVEKAAAADASLSGRLDAIVDEGAHGPVAGGGSGTRDASSAPVGTGGVSREGGAKGQGNAGHGDVSRDRPMASPTSADRAAAGELPTDLSPFERELYGALSPAVETEPRLTPNYDADAEARYRAANAGHAERVQTYKDAPGVGQVLAPGQRVGEWKLGDSQVASTLFNSGKGSAERIHAFLKAGGDRADLLSDLKDYAAFSLRRAAEDANGTLEPKAYQRWMDAHREAMTAFPGLAAKFETAAKARTSLDQTVAAHVAARDAFEKSAASHFLGDADPVMRIGRILKSDTADATMRDLAKMTAKNPAARAGLQRAAVDYILGEIRANSFAGDSAIRQLKNDAFLTFVRKASGPMGHIFTPEQIKAIEDVGTDIQRTQRSVIGTKLPGGSNTAQDTAAGLHHGGGKPSMIGTLVAAEAMGEIAQHASGLGIIGKVGGMILAPITQAMRQEGMTKVDDLVTQAMLHPELARALLAKVPAPAFARPVMRNAARQILALSALSSSRFKEGSR